ncbi:pectate lyase-like adhesive domain-containing protein [uncultured Methanobrevibacter sp.]|uniref:pectate lyase-like adhesive domain-containing protein n=1 Tax=uncultured Methanobrevibacter sp. TaxID=253161 RepID=UPI0026115CA1|nr:pectate lyase-like adhesive domain-containing protein [uncultured Methanobrevibacter sp.]
MILFALISLSCISAADNNAPDEIIAQDNGINAGEIITQSNSYTEEILTDGENEISDFSTLNTEIANSATSTIQLTKNYTYNPKNDSNYTTGIVIDKADFTVDGQGHTLDGGGLARIFNITANNVTLTS